MAKKKMEIIEEVVAENVQEENLQEEDTVVEFFPMTLDELKEKITVKPRVGFIEKQAIVRSVYDTAVVKDEINGIYFVDQIMLTVSFSLALLSAYTDFYEVVGKNASNYGYDYLDETGMFDYIRENINYTDFRELKTAVNDIRNRVDSLNSVGSCIYRTVGDFVNKIPDTKELGKLVKSLPKVLNNVDKDVLGVFAKELGNGTILSKMAENNNKVIDINNSK
jgi:hypothetical protein